MRDAMALDRAGVACIYLEGIPREVAAMITEEVGTPTIGIGAGPECDGQVLVFHDILNLTFGPPAKFVRRYGDAAALITHAVQAFRADVKSRQYPADEESYHLPKETGAGLDTVLDAEAGDGTVGAELLCHGFALITRIGLGNSGAVFSVPSTSEAARLLSLMVLR